MNVLVINAGSSSVKFGIYSPKACLFKQTITADDNLADAIRQIPVILASLDDCLPLDAVAHRVVHGGAHLSQPCVITPAVITAIEAATPLAPLHNPANMAGIHLASECWPHLPQVAVFDTAFHQTIPEYARTYAIPKAWRDLGIRRYGFHGTSHHYVMNQVSQYLAASPRALRMISCHLGNGASVCAIDRGQSVDTSMGMSTLEGLVMGTRSGDIDPGLYHFLMRDKQLSAEQIERALYAESGLLGLSGVSHDVLAIERAAAEGDTAAQLALQVFAYRVRKYIGAYAAAMNGLDVLAFTGGIGENSAAMRHRICEGLSFLGLTLDFDQNQSVTITPDDPVGRVAPIHRATSPTKILVLAAQEAWMIAYLTRQCLARSNGVEQAARSDAYVPHQADGEIMRIPVAVSVRHAHLTQETVERLFGVGYTLTPHKALSQPGYWAAEETIKIIGPRGHIDHVRILGPCRDQNQIEVSQTETFHLGIDAPVRMSGDLDNTPTVKLVGPQGECDTEGVIVARRHIHMNPSDAQAHGLRDHQAVSVMIDHSQRDLVFHNVIIRIQENARTEMHIDTDEANAADIMHSPENVRTASGRWAILVAQP